MQIVAHLVESYNGNASVNAVDGDPVPVPHFGLAISEPQFHELASRIRDAGVHFEIEPHVRFQGQPGEQWTMFLKDPSQNCLEFKAMAVPSNLFAKYTVQ
jgi:extradiol dioxygenase family protein